MSDAVVSKRYADALFQLAEEKNNAKSLVEELEVVKAVFQSNTKFIHLLNHPKISTEDKMKLVEDVFASCDKDIVRTIKILVKRHRIAIVEEMINQVRDNYNDANGIADATVRSVRELSDNEKENIAVSLRKQLQKTEININNIIDPSVLGGLKIRVGNAIYDGTISNKLNQIKHNIGTPSI